MRTGRSSNALTTSAASRRAIVDPHGFIWDHGGHVMFSHYSYFDELVEKMLGADYDEHMREAWVWLHGRFVPYPFQNNIHRLPPDVFMDCIMGIIDAQREATAQGQLRLSTSPRCSARASPNTSCGPTTSRCGPIRWR